MTTVDPASLAAYTAGVEAARAAYDDDPFAASRASALQEAKSARLWWRITSDEYRARLADIAYCYPRGGR